MAKKAKKPARVPSDLNEMRMLPWEDYFDPRKKRRAAINISVVASQGFDVNMWMAKWITILIVNEVVSGVDGVGHKTVNPGALAEWRGLLQTAVYMRLVDGGDWFAEGAGVLAVANDMGTIAGLLAGADAEAGPDQLKSAFAATKFHTRCAAAGMGGGAWCSFDWI